MSLFSRPLRATCSVALLLPAFLAGCAGDKQPTKFAPLRYDYLSVMHLNAATLNIEDATLQNPVVGDIGNRAPTPPAQALRQMAQDRLVATGASGTAQFVIDRASILHKAGGVLAGQMDVHLVLLNSGGTQAARAEAHVSQTLRPDLSKGDADSQANLYELTNDMMQRMNVEFEYQIRNTLKDWMTDAGGTPVGSAIQSQSLDAPGTKSRTGSGRSHGCNQRPRADNTGHHDAAGYHPDHHHTHGDNADRHHPECFRAGCNIRHHAAGKRACC